MQDINPDNITADKLNLPLLSEKNVEADVLRLDKIHPVVSGNKWFKLRYYLEEAILRRKKTIVTFGGAWSNHIVATAAACKIKKLKSIGIIRGEEPTLHSSTLADAQRLGMQLSFISRQNYSKKNIPEELENNDYFFINEGGYGIKGAEGAATILDHCNKETYTHICCAAGTGTMMAGLIKASLLTNKVMGISILKNNFDLKENVEHLLNHPKKNYEIIHDYHFGGYAKKNTQLIDFMNSFYGKTSVPSDFVYTGKLFFAVTDLVNNNFFPAGSKLLLIHSGGLQGNTSLSKGVLKF
jgi:1-aminocyclopropane-1-carboxylate deaminase